MTTQDLSIQNLAQKNHELREKLAAAEQWIGREFSDRKLRIQKEATMDKTRAELVETTEHIEKRIKKYFATDMDLV
jgi:uncharacterized membrane-anchored protein YjiN (DUF445 family)